MNKYRQTDRQTNTQTDRQTGKQKDRQTGTQIERQINRRDDLLSIVTMLEASLNK